MLCLRRYVGSIRALESRRYASPTGVARRPVAALYGWGHADVHRLTDTAAPWPLDAKEVLDRDGAQHRPDLAIDPRHLLYFPHW